ncbi:hypothetical protein [Scytonema sp. PRP1]|uniref:hypothetical protein n=1 Tax=Scytonema sp. PRP1 TaxID=3120513 RepID=UPI002FD00E40
MQPLQNVRCLTRLLKAAHLGELLPIRFCHSLELLGSDIDYVNGVCDVNEIYSRSLAVTIDMLNHLRTPPLRSIAFLANAL